MKTLHVASIGLVVVATAIALLFGTVGWVAVGFAVLTDCTDNYDCSTTNCAPCRMTGLWLNAGGLAQLLLAATGVGLLIRGVRMRQTDRLAVGGAMLVVASVSVVLGTSWLAERSYCQPGSPGYVDSYCSTGS